MINVSHGKMSLFISVSQINNIIRLILWLQQIIDVLATDNYNIFPCPVIVKFLVRCMYLFLQLIQCNTMSKCRFSHNTQKRHAYSQNAGSKRSAETMINVFINPELLRFLASNFKKPTEYCNHPAVASI